MKISVVGTGYVGLVTGVCLADIGHQVTCIDIDKEKVKQLKEGIPPIYEQGLEELMAKNIESGRLSFTSELDEGYKDVQVIYIAVGTPQNENGSADLSYVSLAAKGIAENINHNVVIVTKSTVPVGTNDHIKSIVLKYLKAPVSVDMVSNPEFLREGSAIKDTFESDRIVIGSDNKAAGDMIEKVNEPFGLPVFRTDVKSAEMIKYASNAFLATKISFINEIANICGKIGANIEDVSKGMGIDRRIGPQFLNAGIGYGGSCFPKDTNALVQIAGNVEHEFELLKSVIKVNNHQQLLLVNKANQRLGDLKGLNIALLGLAFKPKTDDMREAPSIVISEELVKQGANVTAYDPLAIENAQSIFPNEVQFTDSIEDAIGQADVAFILTEWDDIKDLNLERAYQLMRQPIIFDGRNTFPLDAIKGTGFEYHSIGRPTIDELNET
ncbi:UDP-glucose dehydrogenase family protein [Tuberibacillus sp. Marseille-P3662]|uniref:UDP-glucose dehydrogenase family protein n=1 Tax=Tuberibacillus sp. Marseille-P3662 TaxID=1965358 RepID=UPI000A1C87F2|nr:UDP-glucose/GDP-mannose dehydrogenase family protein [Tuberibacillus sp. Marseille-P3662]